MTCKIEQEDSPGGPVVKTRAVNAWGMDSIPGQRNKISQAMQCSQKIKTNKQTNKNGEQEETEKSWVKCFVSIRIQDVYRELSVIVHFGKSKECVKKLYGKW